MTANEYTASKQPTTQVSQPWQTYQQFFGSNPEALKMEGYGFKQPGTDLGAGSNWSTVGGNPYRFRNEYNQYLETLPQTEGMLARSGVRTQALPNAPIAQPGDTPEQTAARIAGGTGSSFSLAPEVLNKMWR